MSGISGLRRSLRHRTVGGTLVALVLAALLAAPAVSAAPTGSLVPLSAPSGFKALSASFISSKEGFVLGSVVCGTRHCPALAHTTNGGTTWSTLSVPSTAVTASRDLESRHGISTVRFANAHDGWLFDPELWATHDGGHTWTAVSVPGAVGAPVVALEAANGTAHLVLYNGASLFRIASTPVHTNAWALAHRTLAVGAGPVPEIQLVLEGAAGWILQNDRTVINGARLVDGTWVGWSPACATVVGPAYLAGISSTHLDAVCDVGIFSTPRGEHLYRSTNGGLSFTATGATLPTYAASAAAAAGTSTIEAIGALGSHVLLEATFNGGASWHSLMTLPSGAVGDFGFTNLADGLLTVSGHLYLTRDGGHTWRNVVF